jgi:hypothetical protein
MVAVQPRSAADMLPAEMRGSSSTEDETKDIIHPVGRVPADRRYHLVSPGDIISESADDFIGVCSPDRRPGATAGPGPSYCGSESGYCSRPGTPGCTADPPACNSSKSRGDPLLVIPDVSSAMDKAAMRILTRQSRRPIVIGPALTTR